MLNRMTLLQSNPTCRGNAGAIQGQGPKRDGPIGFCECGCGGKTTISKWSDKRYGWIRGESKRFISGHNNHKTGFLINKNGCWIYTGYLKKDGYGIKSLNKKRIPAHRAYYQELKEPIPNGLQLDHLCRIRSCVNPEHLEAVSPRENSRRSSCVKLNTKKVKQIRLLLKTNGAKYFANRYGVSLSTISDIKHFYSWKNLE